MSYSSDADKDFIAAAMPAFISEAGEQIEAIETLLLELEEQPEGLRWGMSAEVEILGE